MGWRLRPGLLPFLWAIAFALGYLLPLLRFIAIALGYSIAAASDYCLSPVLFFPLGPMPLLTTTSVSNRISTLKEHHRDTTQTLHSNNKHEDMNRACVLASL